MCVYYYYLSAVIIYGRRRRRRRRYLFGFWLLYGVWQRNVVDDDYNIYNTPSRRDLYHVGDYDVCVYTYDENRKH